MPFHPEKQYFASILCLGGVFLHILFSDPLLGTLGFHYSGDEGRFYEKIHPGSVLIFLSLAVLLVNGKNPLTRLGMLYLEYRAYVILLLVYILMFGYMAVRSGVSGLAFILDTHITAVICAIVLSHALPALCRKAVAFFILLAIINSIAGLCEALCHCRMFTFEADWSVLHEEHFRASAFIGHPLDNAIFTVIALFILLNTGYYMLIRIILTILFLLSLVAFGGRVALVFSVSALLVMMIYYPFRLLYRRHITPKHIFYGLAFLAGFTLVACLFAWLVLYTHVGERLVQSHSWDDSADARRLSFLVFSYMKTEEIIFGIPGPRIMEIVARVNQKYPLSDVENPWILMAMYLGGVMFAFWLATTLAFISRLMKFQPFTLQMVVIAYFIIASTSNTFGRKDANYAIMVSMVICMARILPPQPPVKHTIHE